MPPLQTEPTGIEKERALLSVESPDGKVRATAFLDGYLRLTDTATNKSRPIMMAVLFFPVINSVNIDTPNVCGQGPNRIPIKDLRAASAAVIDGATNLSVTVDYIPIKNLRRVKSEVFAVALPEDNVFVAPCAPLPVPAGIYSPAVDDGIYVLLMPLPVGPHKLHFHAESPAAGIIEDVTYNLAVVQVLLK